MYSKVKNAVDNSVVFNGKGTITNLGWLAFCGTPYLAFSKNKLK